MNILIPPSQVIDTVELYFIPSKHRLLSLKFLAWIVLGQIIQEDSHDSIVDAKISLDLFKRYKECVADGTFESLLEKIYSDGSAFGFKVPANVGASEGRLVHKRVTRFVLD
jgi:PAB-dependent poly(A)-specific ribonuclease subunit 2